MTSQNIKANRVSRFKLDQCNAKLRRQIAEAIEREDSASCARKDTKLECNPIAEPLAQNQTEKGATGKLHIKFVSVRKRLCDPDNLSVKWLLDCLRYCGAISGDEPEKITLEVGQEKCAKGQTEETIIEITAAVPCSRD